MKTTEQTITSNNNKASEKKPFISVFIGGLPNELSEREFLERLESKRWRAASDSSRSSLGNRSSSKT